VATASFVYVLCTNQNSIRTLSLSLRPVGRIATDDTDCQSLRNVLRHSEQLWHRFEWLSPIVLVESCYDYSLALICQLLADFNQIGFEELTFVNANNLCILAKCENL